jgi:pyruvate dehydrogenase E2 component (dihydrolipoamide acetyltransferase)
MPTNVIMPQMGESIFEGTITKWLKKVGDRVGRDEPLFEISTDKVDSEIPSPAAGVLTEILVPEGKTVQINTVLAVIDGERTEAAPAPAAGTRPAAPPAPAPQPPPAKPAPPAPAEQRTTDVKPLDEIERQTTAAQEGGKPREKEPEPVRTAPAAAVPPTVEPHEIRTSPLVRRLARENGIDLADVRGTGAEGRITRQDIENYIQKKQQAAAAPAEVLPPARVLAEETPGKAAAEGIRPTAAAPAAPAPAPEMPRFFGESDTVPMTAMRKAISEHMVFSKRTSAHVNTIFEVDMSAVVALREKHKGEFEKREGVKLTYTPFLVKALVDTVREFPVVNASVSGDSIVFKKPVNVGIAVALDTGLIVPVIKDAHLKSFTGLVLAINDMAEKARTKRLRPDDVQNGTITITNPGIYGSLFGTPIINQPQVAILGVGGIEKRPVVVNDAIAIRSMVYLSLSFDHRIIDGAVADQFMARLKQRLETWTAWVD